MNGSRFYGALVALTLAATTAGAQTAKLGDKDVAAIKSSSDAFSKGLVAGDPAAVSLFYTEGASFLPPNDKAIAGRAAISTWIKALPPVKDFKLTPVEIEGRGDLAYVKGTFAMTLVPPGAPGPVNDVGKYLEIRRKQADGSWLIAVDIFNSDLPPPR
jgi:ketosteroid isomerase-like protein